MKKLVFYIPYTALVLLLMQGRWQFTLLIFLGKFLCLFFTAINRARNTTIVNGTVGMGVIVLISIVLTIFIPEYKIAGMLTLGFFLNWLPVAFNNDRMPIADAFITKQIAALMKMRMENMNENLTPDQIQIFGKNLLQTRVYDKGYMPASHCNRFKYLGDVIEVPKFECIISAGDMVQYGAYLLVIVLFWPF